MKLTIENLRGMWRGQIDNRTEFGDTLEELLARLAPGAPEDYVYHAGEVLGGILGAEVVEFAPQLGSDLVDFLKELMEEPWQPTEEQAAYFEPERTEEADEFNPDEMPRGV